MAETYYSQEINNFMLTDQVTSRNVAEIYQSSLDLPNTDVSGIKNPFKVMNAVTQLLSCLTVSVGLST